jgi:hypothetical protein
VSRATDPVPPTSTRHSRNLGHSGTWSSIGVAESMRRPSGRHLPCRTRMANWFVCRTMTIGRTRPRSAAMPLRLFSVPSALAGGVRRQGRPQSGRLAQLLPHRGLKARWLAVPFCFMPPGGHQPEGNVPPAGFEPAHRAPEARALSPELRGRPPNPNGSCGPPDDRGSFGGRRSSPRAPRCRCRCGPLPR